MFCDTKIHLVCLLRSYRRLRVVFQEEIRPLLQTQLFPFPYYIQCIVISGLKEARNVSRSVFRKRMFRPITRRWGICLRSTQRYTVCGLTPRYLDASFTDRGRSSDGVELYRSI